MSAQKLEDGFGTSDGEGGGPVRELGDDDGSDPDGDEANIVIERNWRYVGFGFLDAEQAALALTAAAMAREHHRR